MNFNNLTKELIVMSQKIGAYGATPTVGKYFTIKTYAGSREDVERKFRRSAQYYVSREQEEVNEAMSNLDENSWIAMYIATKAEYESPEFDDDVRKVIQNHRSRIAAAVRYNDYPRMAGGKRYAYQTTLSLEPDNCYWLLVRRLAPMRATNPNGKEEIAKVGS